MIFENEIPLSELDVFRIKALHDLQSFLDLWETSLPADNFPETMLPGDIRDLIEEVIQDDCPPPPSFRRKGRLYYPRVGFLSWFKLNILKRYSE